MSSHDVCGQKCDVFFLRLCCNIHNAARLRAGVADVKVVETTQI